MAFFDKLTHGTRGYRPEQRMSARQLEAYGIDWEAYRDNDIRRHYLANNEADPFPQNPFVPHRPETYSIVDVEGPSCPLNDQELAVFYQSLSQIPQDVLCSRSMEERKSVFKYALFVCNQIKGNTFL